MPPRLLRCAPALVTLGMAGLLLGMSLPMRSSNAKEEGRITALRAERPMSGVKCPLPPASQEHASVAAFGRFWPERGVATPGARDLP